MFHRTIFSQATFSQATFSQATFSQATFSQAIAAKRALNANHSARLLAYAAPRPRRR
ncbi:MAG: hypothetical protein D6742_15880 [Cyanobacteria bacterium J069]|nr:MAG: hypothetical protein D6742_15880 [Cyanobacteria bacterium J069]